MNIAESLPSWRRPSMAAAVCCVLASASPAPGADAHFVDMRGASSPDFAFKLDVFRYKDGVYQPVLPFLDLPYAYEGQSSVYPYLYYWTINIKVLDIDPTWTYYGEVSYRFLGGPWIELGPIYPE